MKMLFLFLSAALFLVPVSQAQSALNVQEKAPDTYSKKFIKNSSYNINIADSNFSPRIINSKSAKEISSYSNNPVSIVEYFLARHILNDSAKLTVLHISAEDHETLQKFDRYGIRTAVITGSYPSGKDTYIVRFYYYFTRVSQDGRVFSSNDNIEHFTCKKINGRWMITGIPI